MPTPLEELKTELERYGATNDRATAERSRRMLNITRDTGEFLAVLVRATAAKRILEVGTSNGYSTLWLAEAARATGGSVTTLEALDFKIALARENFARSGLASVITPVAGDAICAGWARVPSILFSSIPNARNTRAGGQICAVPCGPEGSWWWTTPRRIPLKWPLWCGWFPPTLGFRRHWFRSAMANFWP